MIDQIDKQNLKCDAAVGDRAHRVMLDRNEIQNTKKAYCFFKRLQDIVLSIVALIILAIPMLILALVIYIDSPGASPFFKQKRIGLNGREFTLYKLRTMVPHAEEKLCDVMKLNEMDGPVFKIKDDPRITKVGGWARRTCCDELPQFINVLKNDMSLVGPRPALPREVEQYSDYDRQRLYVKPGLSCYWQTQPERNEVSFDEWMDLDNKYIRERGFVTDWKIMLKTVSVMLRRDGR